MSASSPRIFDILVAGAGPAGLAFAAAVAREMGRGASIALVDPRPNQRDGRLRTVALAPGSRHLLERIGAWEALAAQAQPILSMSISDGRVRDAVRLEQLHFDAKDHEPLAHMAFNDDLCDALNGAAAALGVETITDAASALAADRDMAEVTLESGQRLKARLVVAADGARSSLREFADIATVGWDTAMSAIVATIAHERDHEGRAEQHFLPAGPFAVLPLRGRFSSIVWNEAPADVQALLALAPDDFLRELEYRFTLKLGALSLASRVAAFPCSFRFARRFVASRLALLADAAHVVHPLAGQGLNLGFRDVAALAEGVVAQLRLGLDPGAPATLADYQRARRFDTVSSSFGMDALNRLFANDFEPLRAARDFGLRVVDRLAPAKRLLMAEAAGEGRKAPRLLRGEPL